MKTEIPTQTTQLTPALKAGLANEPSLKPLLAAYRAAGAHPADESFDEEELIATGKALCDSALGLILQLGVRAQKSIVVEVNQRGESPPPSMSEQLAAATDLLFYCDRNDPGKVASIVSALFTN